MGRVATKSRSARYKKRTETNLSSGQIILRMLAAFLLVGMCTGLAIGYFLDTSSLTSMKASTGDFLQGLGDGTNRLDIFSGSIIKNGKVVIAIWLLAFVPMGRIVSVLIIFAKGISLGFTTAFLIRCYGATGILYGAALYLPQNLILIPAYLFVAFGSIRFVLPVANKNNRENARIFLAYILCILIGCTCVVVSALMESWLSPVLIGAIWVR